MRTRIGKLPVGTRVCCEFVPSGPYDPEEKEVDYGTVVGDFPGKATIAVRWDIGMPIPKGAKPDGVSIDYGAPGEVEYEFVGFEPVETIRPVLPYRWC